jgi:hypothetical protein
MNATMLKLAKSKEYIKMWGILNVLYVIVALIGITILVLTHNLPMLMIWGACEIIGGILIGVHHSLMSMTLIEYRQSLRSQYGNQDKKN